MMTPHDVDKAEAVLAKLEAVRGKIAKLLVDEMESIIGYKAMQEAAPYMTEWYDDMIHKAKKAAEKTIDDFDIEEQRGHERSENTWSFA